MLTIEWQKYAVDQKESFVEEIGDPIGEGGILRICVKYLDKSIKTYNYKKDKEDVFIEIVLTEEATITYPGGHSHGDYYDYSTGEYIQNNETIELIKNILEEGLIIKYVFRGQDLIGSGIWQEKNQRFWMMYRMTFEIINPMYWMKKFLGKFEKEREEIITINWKM